MKLQEQPNMHLTFAKTAKMHKTLLCEQLGCLGVGCLRVVVFFWGGVVGLGWLRVVSVWDRGDASRYPCSPTQLALPHTITASAGFAKHLQ